MPLTEDQQTAADALTRGAMCDRDRIQGLGGPGGSGKSFVVRSVADAVKETGGWETMFVTLSHSALGSCPSEYACLVLAALCVRCLWKSHAKKTPNDRLVARWFASRRRVLVIDEAFQLTSEYLEFVFSRLQGASAVLRGGVRIILVGDPGQTKPIGGKPITAHPAVQAARWSYLTSGTMRMTPDWAREVRAFGQNIVLADASVAHHRCERPSEGTMIVTPTRSESLSAATLFLSSPGSFRVLPIIPETDEAGGLEARKASEPYICTPGQPARLVYNVRTADGSRTTPGGFALNNGAKVWFSGLVDKDGAAVHLEPGSDVQLTTKHRVKIHVTNETDAILLAPYVSAGITVVPTRPWWVKTIRAAQGETIDDGVFLYADGPVRQSDYVTAAGRVRSGDKFSVAPSVTRVEPDK